VTLSPIERRVVEAVDADAIVADLATMVAMPSSGGSAGEVAVQRWCGDRLAALGAEVDLWSLDLPALRESPGYPGEEVVRDEALGCVGTFGASVPALILAGHTDVVPPGDLGAWTSDPWRLRDEGGLLYGRGTCDMKGGLAAVLTAISALGATGVRLRRSVAVHCVVGEEDGGIGAYATLQRGHGGDACVIAEPSGATVVTANAGSLTFRLEIPGLAAHGSTRTKGVSALDAATPVLVALRELERRRNRDVDPALADLEIAYPLSIGVVRAGDWASTVPDLLVAEGRYGVRIDEPVEGARAAFESTVAAACEGDPWLASHPARVSWPGGVFASGKLPDGHRLLDDVRSACTDAAQWTPEAKGAPSGSDLRLYAAAGIPTLLLGPGDLAVAHAADEHVALADLVACARAYALLVLRACG